MLRPACCIKNIASCTNKQFIDHVIRFFPGSLQRFAIWEQQLHQKTENTVYSQIKVIFARTCLMYKDPVQVNFSKSTKYTRFFLRNQGPGLVGSFLDFRRLSNTKFSNLFLKREVPFCLLLPNTFPNRTAKFKAIFC